MNDSSSHPRSARLRHPGVRRLPVLVLLVMTVGAGVAAQERDVAPVTDAMLQNPDPADWLNWRRTLDGWGYSPLDQIDRDNVHRLQLVWGWQMNTGTNQPTPLVHDGVMYLANPGNVVQALDAVTGDRLWEYRRDLDDVVESVLAPRSRSIAIYGDKVYLNTADAHIVALDRVTGEVAWDHEVADNALGYRYTSGPIVANGKVVAGMTGCERFKEDVCFISAHDAQTGEELWRTSTIARPGDPGGDSWGDLPLLYRAGADSWIPGQLRSRDQPDLLVDLAGQAVGQRDPRDRRGRALQQQRAGPRRRHRRAVVVLPVHPRRDPRPRRRVRERAHRSPRATVALQDGQARHPVGARPRHRTVRRGARPRVPGRPRHRPADGSGDLQARDDSRGRCRDRVLSRLRRHPQLAGVGLPPGDAGALHPDSPDLRQRRVHRNPERIPGAPLLREHRLALARQHGPSGQRATPRPPDRDGHRHRATSCGGTRCRHARARPR